MVTTDDEDLAWQARSFRDHGYDVKERLNLLELEQKLPYIHNLVGWNYRMTEMQSAIGLAELERMDTWNMPAPAPQRPASSWTRCGTLPQVKYLPDRHARAAERLVRAGLLARHREDELRHPASSSTAAGAEGAPVLEGLLAAVPHRAGLPASTTPSAARGFPFTSKEYTDPASVDYTQGRGAQRLLARDAHLHLLRLPDLHRGRLRQIGAALGKVIKAYTDPEGADGGGHGEVGRHRVGRHRPPAHDPRGDRRRAQRAARRGLRRRRRGQPRGRAAVRRGGVPQPARGSRGGRRRGLHRHARAPARTAGRRLREGGQARALREAAGAHRARRPQDGGGVPGGRRHAGHRVHDAALRPAPGSHGT